MKVYLDCSPLTNAHLSGIGVYNKNLFMGLSEILGKDIDPVLKLSRFSRSRFVQNHLQQKTRCLFPVLLNKNIIYHGTDHKLNTMSLGPTIVTIHDMQPFEDRWLDPTFARKRRAVLDQTLRSGPDGIIAVSHFTKNEIIKYYPKLAPKISVIYHGVGPGSLTLEKEENRLPALLGGRPFLLFIGNLEERKNLVNQVRAFEILKKNNPDLLFVLAGRPGYLYEEIAQELSRSSYKNSLVFTGYLNETEKRFALKNTQCLMFATWYEGFGIPVIEALSYNAKVLISQASALVEIAGPYCYSAEASSPEDMAEKAQKIMDHGNKMQIDQSVWSNQWSWHQAAHQTISAYQRL